MSIDVPEWAAEAATALPYPLVFPPSPPPSNPPRLKSARNGALGNPAC